MKPGGKEPDRGSVYDASPSWDRERGQQLTEALAGHSTGKGAWSRGENNSLCLSFIGSGVLSVVKMCFFSRQSKYNLQGTQEANVGKSKMPLLQGHISDEERRGMQPALLRLWLRRHSSKNTLCKDLISVHNSKDAQKEFRIDLFPIKSTNRKWPDLLHPTQCSGTSHWIQPMVSNQSGLWAMVSSSMHTPL